MFDNDTAAQLKTLVAKGAAGGRFFSTDDCQTNDDELKRRA